MATPVTYEQVLELVKQLPAEERARLAQEMNQLPTLAQSPTKKRSLLDLAGTLPYPACGEEAHDMVRRTREEWDERERRHREAS